MSRGWQGQDEKCYWVPDCDIEGTLPAGLSGTLIRNGPGLNEVYGKKLKHPIDGDGMICKVTFVDGKVHFHSRFVRSSHRKAEEKARQFQFPGQMGTRNTGVVRDALNTCAVLFGGKSTLKFRNPSNTNAFYWGGKLLSLYETSLPYCLDPYTLETLGLDDLNGTLKLKNSAVHFRIDPQSMTLFLFALRASMHHAALLEVYEFDQSWKLVNKWQHHVTNLNYAHDFLLFPDYFMFHITPFTDISQWTAMQILMGWQSPGGSMRYYPGKLSQFVVIPRRGDGEIQYFDTDPCHIFHFGTAEQTKEGLSFNCVCLDEKFTMEFAQQFWLSNTDVSPGRIFQVDINFSEKSCKRRQLDKCSAEFPSTHPYRNGAPGTRYLYAMASDRAQLLPYRDVVKLDVSTGERWVWNSDGIIGEPVFVPRHGYAANKDGAEDDGYVVVQLYRPTEHRTDFCVLDAQNVHKGPVVRVRLKHHVPYGFHGTFTPFVFHNVPPKARL